MDKKQINFVYKEAEKRTSVHAEQIAFAVGAQWAIAHLDDIINVSESKQAEKINNALNNWKENRGKK